MQLKTLHSRLTADSVLIRLSEDYLKGNNFHLVLGRGVSKITIIPGIARPAF